MMPQLANARQEAFARHSALGLGPVEAAMAAGYRGKRIAGTAGTLAADAAVRARIAELGAAVSSRLVPAVIAAGGTGRDAAGDAIDETWVMARLRLVAERSLQAEPVTDRDGNPTGSFTFNAAGANRALELMGKALGMFVDRREIRTGPLETKSDHELDALIHKLAAEAGLGPGPGGEGAAPAGEPAGELPAVR
jgi:phage terminase small subunit